MFHLNPVISTENIRKSKIFLCFLGASEGSLRWKSVNKNFSLLLQTMVRVRPSTPSTTILVTSHIHEKYQKLQPL